jgi:hypothetical protein
MSANVQPSCIQLDSLTPISRCVMASRVRHCVECPKCFTRYLIGFSPYRNGSYLVPMNTGVQQQWTLYCSCGSPHSPSRWSWDELRPYEVSNGAHIRGYGPPEEITALRRRSV